VHVCVCVNKIKDGNDMAHDFDLTLTEIQVITKH